MAKGNNPSIREFRKLTADMKVDVLETAVTALNHEADYLVTRMKANCPVKTGALRDSIRKEAGKAVTIVRIKAGGAKTTNARAGHRKGGYSYDYSRAVEFGTQHDPAQPFFYTTYRANKRNMRRNVKGLVKAAIEKYSAE